MIQSLSQWFQRRFVGTELGSLALITLAVILAIWLMGNILAPVFVSIAIAYLLDGSIRRLERWKFPHFIAVNLVFLLFLGALVVGLFFLLPLVWDQLITLLNEMPSKIKLAEQYVVQLSQQYPDYISKAQAQKWMTSFQSDIAKLGTRALSYSITTISSLVMLVVYLILVPLIVYFLMKDRNAILKWMTQFLPKKRGLAREVWREVNQQIGNYIRGKIIEIIIVGFVTTIAFMILGLNYAILLGVLVGIANIIPYVGAILVTVPVFIVGYLQWGFEAQLLYLAIIYIVINVLDGNVLAPLLFSETMKLHPVAVIIAVLIFGGLWGFWGIFFALPLASVAKALSNAWLKHEQR